MPLPPPLPCCHHSLGPAVWLGHNFQWVDIFLSSVVFLVTHLWNFWTGRLLPGTAQPLCRQVNCRNSLLLHQGAPRRLVNLDTEVLNWNPQSIFYKSFDLDGVDLSTLPFCCLSITGWKNCCFLLSGSSIHYSQLHTQKHWEFKLEYIEGDSVSLHHFCIQFFKLFHLPTELTKLT